MITSLWYMLYAASTDKTVMTLPQAVAYALQDSQAEADVDEPLVR
jgi:hypothetical protein